MLASVTIEWTQISVVVVVLTTLAGAAVAYLRLFMRAELLTVERSILRRVSLSYENQKVASLKATQINAQILELKKGVDGLKADIKDLKDK